MGASIYLATNSPRYIFFRAQQKKEIHRSLEQFEGE